MLKKIAIFSLILAAFSLYAEGEYEGKLQETVVTATGFSDNIENQIKNITVITSEDIQEKLTIRTVLMEQISLDLMRE